jgi:hypothetical protein
VEIKMNQLVNANQDAKVALKINAVKMDPCKAGISAMGLLFNKV